MVVCATSATSGIWSDESGEEKTDRPLRRYSLLLWTAGLAFAAGMLLPWSVSQSGNPAQIESQFRIPLPAGRLMPG